VGEESEKQCEEGGWDRVRRSEGEKRRRGERKEGDRDTEVRG